MLQIDSNEILLKKEMLESLRKKKRSRKKLPNYTLHTTYVIYGVIFKMKKITRLFEQFL